MFIYARKSSIEDQQEGHKTDIKQDEVGERRRFARHSITIILKPR